MYLIKLQFKHIHTFGENRLTDINLQIAYVQYIYLYIYVIRKYHISTELTFLSFIFSNPSASMLDSFYIMYSVKVSQNVPLGECKYFAKFMRCMQIRGSREVSSSEIGKQPLFISLIIISLPMSLSLILSLFLYLYLYSVCE